jgi:hypothetical protein
MLGQGIAELDVKLKNLPKKTCKVCSNKSVLHGPCTGTKKAKAKENKEALGPHAGAKRVKGKENREALPKKKVKLSKQLLPMAKSKEFMDSSSSEEDR